VSLPGTRVVRVGRLVVDHHFTVVIADIGSVLPVVGDDVTQLTRTGVGVRATAGPLHVGGLPVHGAVVRREVAVGSPRTATSPRLLFARLLGVDAIQDVGTGVHEFPEPTHLTHHPTLRSLAEL